jgi:hypothetical protein
MFCSRPTIVFYGVTDTPRLNLLLPTLRETFRRVRAGQTFLKLALERTDLFHQLVGIKHVAPGDTLAARVETDQPPGFPRMKPKISGNQNSSWGPLCRY